MTIKHMTVPIKLIALLQLLGGLFGMGLVLLATTESYRTDKQMSGYDLTLEKKSAGPSALGLVPAILGAVAGGLLLARRVAGLRLSYVNVGLQTLFFSLGGLSFQYVAGLGAFVRVAFKAPLAKSELGWGADAGFNCYLFLKDNVQSTTTVGVNVVAVAAFLFLLKFGVRRARELKAEATRQEVAAESKAPRGREPSP